MHVFITGCSSGFGLETAVRFARGGHRVTATMRDLSRRAALDDAMTKAGVSLEVAQLDVTDPLSIARTVGVASAYAPIDVLINNAGFQVWASIEETDDADVVAQFDTNVTGLLRITRAVLPSMRQRGRGVLVNLSSVVGMTGSPFEGLYSATKHAVEALSETLYFEVKPFGIRVIVIQPGGYPTTFAANARLGKFFDPATSPYSRGYEQWTSTLARLAAHAGIVADPAEVGETIFAAVADENAPLYWPVGQEATLVAELRRPIAFETYEQNLRGAIGWWD